MYFKIVEQFGPESGDSWNEYLEWRKISFERFDSVDSMMRPDLFEPKTSKDWDNCVNEDYRLNLLTSLDFAKASAREHSNYEIVGVEIELENSPSEVEGLLGFDIIDSYCATSLLTNWGIDDLGFINEKLGNNGLISNFSDAKALRDRLRSEFWEDSHAHECSVWAIYRTTT
ncbi:hypothetical protein SBW85_05055 [Vibrio plantisponsor]|uniref:Uncharacterized protein n=1 Tax=Vibrio plantisponsor TaxID=664643 RepID=A0ABU4IFW6_9VIBR|nr:hypothetical protein [Vibrio plantisponsor]MDW6017139.1 hypothetical protein [Vibrio plantisponsor]NNM40081.1 hypothetical protein [Vibrio plantisponsor]